MHSSGTIWIELPSFLMRWAVVEVYGTEAHPPCTVVRSPGPGRRRDRARRRGRLNEENRRGRSAEASFLIRWCTPLSKNSSSSCESMELYEVLLRTDPTRPMEFTTCCCATRSEQLVRDLGGMWIRLAEGEDGGARVEQRN